MRRDDKVYYAGIVVEVIAIVGISRHWCEELSLIAFTVGLAMILTGYIK